MSAVALPRWRAEPGDRERGLADVDAWVEALLATGILEAFDQGATQSSTQSVTTSVMTRIASLDSARALEALDVFAGDHWDFRGGRERNLAAVPQLNHEQRMALDRATAALGLDGTPPPRHPHYDAVLLTGGMVRAGIVKPRFLRELHDAGLTWGEGVFLGGFRPFAGDEVELAPRLGVQGGDEVDAMVAGMRQAFNLAEPTSSATGGEGRAAWAALSWQRGELVLRVIAAPSSEPQSRRANTADTYRYWADRAEGVRSVLVITTPVYVPYQGATAVEILGLEYGFSVETVAVSANASDLGADSQPFLPHHRLQELRSAVHGMRRLREKLAVFP